MWPRLLLSVLLLIACCETAPSKYDHYKWLGVDRGANPATIKRAYRKMAIKFHPDKVARKCTATDDMECLRKANSRFANMNNAYECLSDPHQRRLYDRQLGGGRRPSQREYDHASAWNAGRRHANPYPGGFGRNSGGGAARRQSIGDVLRQHPDIRRQTHSMTLPTFQRLTGLYKQVRSTLPVCCSHTAALTAAALILLL